MTHLTFDATTITTENRGSYMNVEVTTNFPNEVLDNFTTDELIEYITPEKLLNTMCIDDIISYLTSRGYAVV